MRELVALRSYTDIFLHYAKSRNSFWFSNFLKQQVLLFDKIGIVGGVTPNSAILDTDFELSNDDKADLRYLEENNLIFDFESYMETFSHGQTPSLPTDFIPPPNVETVAYKDNIFYGTTPNGPYEFILPLNVAKDLTRISQAKAKLINEYSKHWDALFRRSKSKAKKKTSSFERELMEEYHLTYSDADIEEMTKYGELLDKRRESELPHQLNNDALELRYWALIMESLEQELDVVTILPYSMYTHNIPNSKKSDVVQIVINQLPLPDGLTPWEQIIDYKNDPSTKNNVLALRRWISKISSENLSRAEIDDELQWLMNEFRSHIKLHKMKTNTETLETIVKAPLEIIEDLIKFKFSKIPDPFFALKKRQISLMEAELNTPGREIAYLIKTKELFDTNE
jgi:hypothetical protein